MRKKIKNLGSYVQVDVEQWEKNPKMCTRCCLLKTVQDFDLKPEWWIKISRKMSLPKKISNFEEYQKILESECRSCVTFKLRKNREQLIMDDFEEDLVPNFFVILRGENHRA